MRLRAQLLENTAGLGKAGQIIQFALSPSDVHIAHEIDTFLAGTPPQGFRADEACPIALVDKATDKFRTLGSNNVFRMVEVRTSRQAGIREVDIESSLDTYLVEERALGAFIPRATEAQATFDVKAQHGLRIQTALSLDREVRIFGTGGLLSTAANWNANNVITIGGGAKWDDLENADPIADIQDAVVVSSLPITALFMNPLCAMAMIRTKAVREHLRQMLGDGPATGLVNATAIQANQNLDFQIPGIPPIRVCSAKVLNDASGDLEYILDNKVIAVCYPSNGLPTGGQTTMTAVTFRERGLSGNGFTTREFEVQTRGLQGGTMMVSGHAEDERMIANNAGALLEDVLSEAA